MKVKEFLRMGDGYEHVEIVRYDRGTVLIVPETLYMGTIERYFKSDERPDGTIKSWYNNDDGRYNILNIEIE